MKNIISIKIPNLFEHYPIIRNTLYHLTSRFSTHDIRNLDKALQELVQNSIIHSYKDRDGVIEVVFHLFLHGIRVDVIDRHPIIYRVVK